MKLSFILAQLTPFLLFLAAFQGVEAEFSRACETIQGAGKIRVLLVKIQQDSKLACLLENTESYKFSGIVTPEYPYIETGSPSRDETPDEEELSFACGQIYLQTGLNVNTARFTSGDWGCLQRELNRVDPSNTGG